MTPKPLGTPMDAHYFGGIPIDVFNQQAAKRARVAAPTPSENVVSLPIEDAGHRERKRRKNR